MKICGTVRAPPEAASISSRATGSTEMSISSNSAPFFFSSDLARTQ